ncbi:MAG: hypothetical protein IJS14_02475 [Lentisphaeria bacterium]|nr:hypothetical protein [Lentisphaeria bacterium]
MMRKLLWTAGLLAAVSVIAEEIKAPVSGVMIFKNGVSAVRRTADTGKQTEFQLACDLVPLQGSLWFGGPVVSVVRKNVKKPVPGKYPLENITKTFAGKQVTLILSNINGSVQEISGVVWDPEPKPEKQQPGQPLPMNETVVWIKRNDGGSIEMVQRHRIVGVRAAEVPKAANLPEKFDLRPAWQFTLSKPARQPVVIDYLSQGLSWQSAYRIELKNASGMIISQDAEIVNNLDDLNKVTLFLASGFANFVNFGQNSPMAMVQPKTTPQVRYEFSNQFANQSVMRKANYAPRAYAAPDMAYGAEREAPGFGAAGTEETEDISLLPIKDFSLKKGEVCHRVLSSAETSYERLVHWTIGAKRHPDNGHPMGGMQSVPMDALRFKNPFDAPITTSPLEILDGGIVLAQVKIPWVNPKQTATVDITKALTVTGKIIEYEVQPQSTERAEQVFSSLERNRGGKVTAGWIAGMRYRITDVQGEMRLKNYRKQPARLLIEMDHSGVLVSADDDPKQTMLDRTGSVNPRARLTWDIRLNAGEEKTIKYRYNIFVRN